MTGKVINNMPRLSKVRAIKPAMNVWLYIIGLALVLTTSSACPDFCHCYDDFVTCSDFTNLDLTLLPSTAETLVLSQGKMEEIPPAFFARASTLKSVEFNNFNARVVRGGAFRGLNDLEMFNIKSSSFDIVEPDGFSGISSISKFLISDSHFGRVGKHAFAEITDVLDWRIWSTYFANIADEAFYAIGRVHAIQFYQNNISYIGHDIFAGAFEVEYVNFYMNTINIMSNGSLSHIKKHADLLVVYANKFQCLCENGWMTEEPMFEDYLTSNECFFSSEFSIAESLFRMSDVSPGVLCPVTSPEPPPEEIKTTTVGIFPSVIEENFASPNEVYPDNKILDEGFKSGNVSVNNSVHETGVDLVSYFDSNSSSHNSTSSDWSQTANSNFSSNFSTTVFSSLANSSEFINDTNKLGTALPVKETLLSDKLVDPVSSLPAASELKDLEITSESLPTESMSQDFLSIALPKSLSNLSVFDDNESFPLPEELPSDSSEGNFSLPEFPEKEDAIENEDESFTLPVIEESVFTLSEDSMTSEPSHEFPSWHEVEFPAFISTFPPPVSSSEADSSLSISSPSHSSISAHEPRVDIFVPETVQPKINENLVGAFNEPEKTETPEEVSTKVDTTKVKPSLVTFIKLKASKATKRPRPTRIDNRKPHSSYQPKFQPSKSPSARTPAHKASISPSSTFSLSSISSSSPFPSSFPSSTFKRRLPSRSSMSSWSPVTSPSWQQPQKSTSQHPSTSASAESASTSGDAMSLPSEKWPSVPLDNSEENEVIITVEKNHVISDKGKGKSSISLLDLSTRKSFQLEPTATFPIELPYDHPKSARIKSAEESSLKGEGSLNDEAKKGNQIYAFPYSTSAVEMDTEATDSASSSFIYWFLYVFSVTMTILLYF